MRSFNIALIYVNIASVEFLPAYARLRNHDLMIKVTGTS